jgi:uncharacterized repeat protein (TIGR02543 family)
MAKIYRKLTIIFSAILFAFISFLLGLSYFGVFYLSNAVYISSTSTYAEVGEIYNTSTKTFKADELNKLIRYVCGRGGVDTLAYIDSMATGVTDDGLTGATAKSIRNVSYDSVKTSGKDVVVSFGGLKWQVCYLSKVNGDIVMTLWLTNSIQDAWKSGRSQTEGDYYGFIDGSLFSDWSNNIKEKSFKVQAGPTNMYGTSYIRAVTLNNGGQYLSSIGSPYKSFTSTSSSAFAKFTMPSVTGSLTNYIVKPTNVSWQARQDSSKKYGVNYTYTLPNDAFTELSSFNWYTSSTYGSASVMWDYSYRSNYTTWQNDYIWLPSITEIGSNTTYDGIWQLSNTQRANHTGQSLSVSKNAGSKNTNGRVETASWTRTGHYYTGEGVFAIRNTGDDGGTNTLIDMSLAVRPAIHFNLSKAIQNLNETHIYLVNENADYVGTTSIDVAFGSVMPNITPPGKMGCVFQGYYSATNGGGIKYYNYAGKAYNNKTWDKTDERYNLYAYWTGVFFQSDGGSNIPTRVITTYASPMPRLTIVPTWQGHTFNGFYTGKNGTGVKYYNADGTSARNCDFTSNVTLYAYWTAYEYTVTFIYNGGALNGSTTSHSENLKFGQNYTFPVPTRAGYNLIKWTCNYPQDQPLGPYKCNDSGGLTITVPYLGENGNSVTFTAQWSAKPYTVTYNANGGTSPVSTSTVGFGDTYGKKNLYNPALCALNGPITLQNNIFTINSNNTGSSYQWATFYQRFSGSFARNTKYTVVYECLSFSGSSFGITLTSPDDEGTNGNTDISNTGQSYVSVNGVGVYKSSFTTKNSFNLSNMYYDFRSYAAVAPGSNVSATVRVSVFIGDIIYNSFNYATYGNTPSGNVLPTPTKTGYSFTGWYTATSGGSLISNSTTVSTAGNHTIYAHWSPKTFNVNFYSNGGSGSMDSLGVTYNSGSKSLTSNAFTKTNNIFKCWNTSANGSGTTYYENQKVSNLLSNINLYAQWEETWNNSSSLSLSTAQETNKGSISNPYLVSSAEDLAYISKEVEKVNKVSGVILEGTEFSAVYFKQTGNIDLSGKMWKPIGSSSDKAFKGNYDGNGFWIKNLTTSSARVVSSSGNYLYSNVGLFGYTIGATLKNINILNGNVYGNSNVGAIAGYIEAISAGGVKTGTVEGCRNRAKIYGISSCGMIGTSIGCDIISCLNYGDITANSNVGGIVGDNRTEKIKVLNSLACCQISGSDSGGIIGYSSVSGSEIISCGFKGSFKANDENQGLIAGQMYMGKLTDCLALTTMTGKGIGTNGTTVSNCIYNDGSMHKIGSDFSNWSELASGLPLPKGLAWIGYVGMGTISF